MDDFPTSHCEAVPSTWSNEASDAARYMKSRLATESDALVEAIYMAYAILLHLWIRAQMKSESSTCCGLHLHQTAHLTA